jgi:LysR family transcriptional regulator, glycine cleavage system transcriptional activator
MVDQRRFPSLLAIRAFETAARLGSFARAAQELDTTAASVSYHVRRLEEQIGVTLFARYPQRVELTEPGQWVAREAINAFAALRASFIKAANLDEARLSLTTLPTLGTSWLTPKLGRFRTKHPEIALDLDLSPDAQDLSTGHFDAAIRNGHGRWPGLRTVELFPSIFMPLCAPALKDAAAGIADPRGPLDVPLLGRSDWWALWYRSRGFDDVVLHGRFGTHLSAEYLDIATASRSARRSCSATRSRPAGWYGRTTLSPAMAARSGSPAPSPGSTAPRSPGFATGCATKRRATAMPPITTSAGRSSSNRNNGFYPVRADTSKKAGSGLFGLLRLEARRCVTACLGFSDGMMSAHPAAG